ncbi:MAG: NAD(P)H-dependent oxidoreductase [Coxiellaceae bacterium]|nr:NAD(P)H-dependent oxidoreductase [Coxiellaceae bacterium]
MNILYVYAHPNDNSFNAMLKQQALDQLQKQGANVKVSDLYQMGFNPTASWQDFKERPSDLPEQYFLAQSQALASDQLADDIKVEMKKLAWADHIIFQFPLWWFSVPAILKGWFDRVLVKGFAYDAGRVFDKGLLKGKTASLVTSTQSPEALFQPDAVHQATMMDMLHPIHNTLKFVGIEPKDPFVTYVAFQLDEQREAEAKAGFQQFISRQLAGNDT